MANLPNTFGISPLNGQLITISNELSNDMPLLETNVNNLLANLRAAQNTNRLSANDAFNIEENGVNNILRLKNKMGFINDASQQTDYTGTPILNNYLLSPFVSSQNSNTMPSKHAWLNNIQINNAAANVDIPTNKHILNDKPLIRNQYATTTPFGNVQENVMTALTDLQNRINRNSPITEQIIIHSPGSSNDGSWNNNCMNLNPSNTDIRVLTQYPINNPVTMLNSVPFKMNNVAENNWFLGNDITTRNTQQSNCVSESVPIRNNDISPLNILLNNLVNCKSQLEKLPKCNKELQVEGNLLNPVIPNNKSPITGRLTTNKDCFKTDLQNLLNNNILSNRNNMPSQLPPANSNFMPIDKQIANINSILLNNLGNQNYPTISSINGQLTGIPGVYVNSNSKPIDNQIASINNMLFNNLGNQNFPIISNFDRTLIDIPQSLVNSNGISVDKQMASINNLLYNNLGNQNYPIISNIDEPIIDISEAFVNTNSMPIDNQMASINSMLFNNLVNQNYPIISNIDKPSSYPEFSSYMSQVIPNLPRPDTDSPIFNKPVYSLNTNVLNLGEFGSLPIINGFPIASIVETVSVLNSNPNCI